ncbi:hypothetical protein DFJ77DRAFT_462949 [Powellomyces hirtus]|nr:hypothetical protein DFJ77DRAFT_462949 [Powellomyces hirtus]
MFPSSLFRVRVSLLYIANLALERATGPSVNVLLKQASSSATAINTGHSRPPAQAEEFVSQKSHLSTRIASH